MRYMKAWCKECGKNVEISELVIDCDGVINTKLKCGHTRILGFRKVVDICQM
jgi:hypothetical protein